MSNYSELIKKYNVPVPRYTSYPTVPFWKGQIDEKMWLNDVARGVDETGEDGISLYIHLPYCESLCTYCACNARITKNHKVEDRYIQALLAEWQIYLDHLDSAPVIRELHLGGGTPTFFSPSNLDKLISSLLAKAKLHRNYDFSFEGHPNNTTEEHLAALAKLGFKRVSYGVQDLDHRVQKTINRIQPFENLERVVEWSRKHQYASINFDLVYGLPFQSRSSVEKTVDQVLELEPERIAFYSYAHVPWKRPGQRAYTEEHLPDDEEKRSLYEAGKELFIGKGYHDIGMDHFSLSTDSLYKAWCLKDLHRNFMGYTTSKSKVLIGLGASSISESPFSYVQNEKGVEKYIEQVLNNDLAVQRGYQLSQEDRIWKEHIKEISCSGETFWGGHQEKIDLTMQLALHCMEQEGLLDLYESGLRVTDLGMAFIRNICAVFDQKLRVSSQDQNMFSKAI